MLYTLNKSFKVVCPSCGTALQIDAEPAENDREDWQTDEAAGDSGQDGNSDPDNTGSGGELLDSIMRNPETPAEKLAKSILDSAQQRKGVKADQPTVAQSMKAVKLHSAASRKSASQLLEEALGKVRADRRDDNVR
jgi:hypothetical protein